MCLGFDSPADNNQLVDFCRNFFSFLFPHFVRLREIQMSEYDAEMYESYSSRVRRQVQSVRVILDSLQARGKERVWLRNQTSGELDDGKLIEGLTGERAIYKKRGEEDPEVGIAKSLTIKKVHFIDIM